MLGSLIDLTASDEFMGIMRLVLQLAVGIFVIAALTILTCMRIGRICKLACRFRNLGYRDSGFRDKRLTAYITNISI